MNFPNLAQVFSTCATFGVVSNYVAVEANLLICAMQS